MRAGAKVQQARQNQQLAQEKKIEAEHARNLPMKLAAITEKALDKLPS